MEPTGRWWLVHGIEVDLNAEGVVYPVNVRATALAHRYADTPEDEDIADYLDWAIEADPDGAYRVANESLWTKSQEIHARLHAAVCELERRAA